MRNSMNNNTQSGAKVYTPLTLKLYDWWVLKISNKYAWKCPTDDRLLTFFLNNLRKNHLDIGVGTGYYLQQVPMTSTLSLMDLNANSLKATTSRLGADRIHAQLQHDVLQPLPKEWCNRFDSISMFYLIHCLPGSMEFKEQAIINAKQALTQNGQLFGATILGAGVTHNAFGRKLMSVYNKKGIFSNLNDSVEALHQALSNHFTHVTIQQTGKVALFTAECNTKPTSSG